MELKKIKSKMLVNLLALSNVQVTTSVKNLCKSLKKLWKCIKNYSPISIRIRYANLKLYRYKTEKHCLVQIFWN